MSEDAHAASEERWFDDFKVGDRFEVRNVQDFFGAPVVSGTYQGGAIEIPMGGVSPPAVIGGAPHPPPQTGPDFDVFVVTKIGSAGPLVR